MLASATQVRFTWSYYVMYIHMLRPGKVNSFPLGFYMGIYSEEYYDEISDKWEYTTTDERQSII